MSFVNSHRWLVLAKVQRDLEKLHHARVGMVWCCMKCRWSTHRKIHVYIERQLMSRDIQKLEKREIKRDEVRNTTQQQWNENWKETSLNTLNFELSATLGYSDFCDFYWFLDISGFSGSFFRFLRLTSFDFIDDPHRWALRSWQQLLATDGPRWSPVVPGGPRWALP